MTIMKSQAIPSFVDEWVQWNLVHWWQKCEMVQPVWRMVWQFLRRLNINFLHAIALLLLGIYPRERKTWNVPTKTCT